MSRSETSRIKGIAICLVIIGHLSPYFYKSVLLGVLGSVGVTLFLIVSAYGLTLSTDKNGLNNFWPKRIKTVMVPYWLMIASWLVVDSIFFKSYSMKIILLNLIGLDFSRSVDGTMWYIPYIMFWYVIFYVAKKVNHQLLIISLGSAISFAIYVLGFVGDSSYNWGIHSFSFLLGFCLAKKEILFSLINVYTALGSLVLSIFISLFIPFNGLTNIILNLLLSIFILYAVTIVNTNFGWTSNNSYYLYLTEGWLINRIFEQLHFNIMLKLVLFFILLVISTLYISIISKKTLAKIQTF